MEFITIREFNSKDKREVYYYCQWTGNEESLDRLATDIENAENELDGDYSFFWVDRTLLPESVVDIQRKIFKGTFTKCTGTFQWSKEDTENMDGYELAQFLDGCFYRYRLQQKFSNYKNWYQEYLNRKISYQEYLSHSDD